MRFDAGSVVRKFIILVISIMEKGILYVANSQKFIDEILISLRSLRRFNTLPVCLVCTPELNKEEIANLFDLIVVNEQLKNYTYLSKVVGLQHTPFEQTIFLDSDTFVTDSIEELFDILDLVDFATTAEPTLHTTKLGLKYKNIFPEFNSGVVVYKNNKVMNKLLNDWLSVCISRKIKLDMPGLREAVLLNFNEVRFSILPDLYNVHGFKTSLVLYTKVKIIHERLEFKRGVITPNLMSFEKMDVFSQKINRYPYKRIYIPMIGIIPYNWNPLSLSLYIKKKLGYRRVSKKK